MRQSKRAKTEEKPNPEQKDLKKLSLHVNAFGEIVRDVQTDEINAFLDENVPDKKFSEDQEAIK